MNQATHPSFAYHTGRMVGRYKLLELLGSGGTAEVYRSVHPDLARDVAIKILYPTFTNDPGFVKRFRQEAQTAAALHHPHIVQVYDFDVTDDGLYYIVMQYINGSSLEAYLAQNPGPLSVELAYDYYQQVADALQFAHNQGAIHRDLKPANILINGRDHLFLSDFGFAKLVGVDMHTRSSMTLGTPVYMAPEQIESGPVTMATDVYALGAILYEMMAGRRPYESDNVLTLIMSKVEDPPHPPRQHNPAIPPAIEKVILRAMEINPQVRYATVAAMSAALVATLNGNEPVAVIGSQAAPRASGEGKSWRKWLALLPVGLVLLCLLALVLRAQNPVMMNGLVPTSVLVTAVPPTQPAVISVPTNSATPKPSATAVPSMTASPTASPSPTSTATASPTRTPSPTRTASPTATATPTATRTPRPTATHTPTMTATAVLPTPEPPTSIPATNPPPPPTEPPPTEPPPTEPPPTPEPTRTPPPPP